MPCPVKMLQLHPTLYDPMDCSPPSSPVHGILQAKILEWGAISFSGESSQPIEPTSLKSPALAGRFFTTNATNVWDITKVLIIGKLIALKANMEIKIDNAILSFHLKN